MNIEIIGGNAELQKAVKAVLAGKGFAATTTADEPVLNRQNFKTIYRQKLAECVREFPNEYGWPIENVPVVASKMFAALDAGTFNHNSHSFKRTAKALGIKPTRKAILAYWRGEENSI